MLENNKDDVKIMKLSTPHPFPDKLALEFLEGVEEVLVVEELDPVVEENLLRLCGKMGLKITIKGKLTGHLSQQESIAMKV